MSSRFLLTYRYLNMTTVMPSLLCPQSQSREISGCAADMARADSENGPKSSPGQKFTITLLRQYLRSSAASADLMAPPLPDEP